MWPAHRTSRKTWCNLCIWVWFSKQTLSKHLSFPFLSNQILKGFESGKSTGMILTDLQKAFDTLDHNILLNKIKYLGFTSKVIDWFGSYLKIRNIVVSLEKTLSDTGVLNCGASQRSILGPILLLLYVNDMKTALKNCDLWLYTDGWYVYTLCHQNVKFMKEI